MMKSWIALLFGLVIAGCDLFDGENNGEWRTIRFDLDSLAAIPDTVTYGGRSYTIDVELWRNFMPILPPNYSPPLTASIQMEQYDTVMTRRSLYIFGQWIWIIKDSSTAVCCPLVTRDLGNSMVNFFADDGPPWPTGIEVDVVVSLLFKPNSLTPPIELKIRKENVKINRLS